MQCVLWDGPSTEPVTLAEIKAQCEVVRSDQDAMLTAMGVAARMDCENFCRRAFITQSWQLELDYFPATGVIRLPRPRLIAVIGVDYINTNGVQQEWDEDQYLVTYAGEPGRLTPAYNVTWPQTRPTLGAVSITYDCGYGPDASDVPGPIKQAILMMTAHLYDHRSPVDDAPNFAVVPMTVQRLLSDFVVGDYY